MSMTVTARLGLAALLIVPAWTSAQHRPRPADEMARDYNQRIQPINDEIDALRKKLADSDMSMADAAKVVDQQSVLRRNADALWTETQGTLGVSFKQTRESINGYNARNRDLGFQNVLIESVNDGITNVGKYPKKSDFDQNKPAMSAEWEKTFGARLKPFGEQFAQDKESVFKQVKEKFGIDLIAGGNQRLGTSNPYNDDRYYRYYDTADGKLRAGVMRETAENLAKWQQDNAASLKRQRDLKDQLAKEATGLKSFQDQFKQSRDSVGRTMTAVESEVRKVNFAGDWNGSDNVGNWVRLSLSADGRMNWSYGGRSRNYSSGGTWTQTGGRIRMKTDDGNWTLESTITDQNRLDFNEFHRSGQQYRETLNR